MALTKDRKTDIIGTYKTHDPGHRVPRSSSRAPQRAHQLPHRALQDAREGSPLPPRPAEARRPAPAPARLPEAQGHRPLRGADPASRHPQVARTSAARRVRRRCSPARSSGYRPAQQLGLPSSAKDAHMHTRNITIGRQTLSIETGKLAKQADGAVIVRSGDTMVLVTACARRKPARGHRLPAADGRLPRIHLRLGPHPRRLLQARRQADARRKCSPAA